MFCLLTIKDITSAHKKIWIRTSLYQLMESYIRGEKTHLYTTTCAFNSSRRAEWWETTNPLTHSFSIIHQLLHPTLSTTPLINSTNKRLHVSTVHSVLSFPLHWCERELRSSDSLNHSQIRKTWDPLCWVRIKTPKLLTKRQWPPT